MNSLVRFLKIRRTTLSALMATALGAMMIPASASAGILADTNSFVDTSSHTSEFVAIPPFIETATGKPSVILAFDISGSMLVPAYPEEGKHWRNDVHSDFDPDREYFGYFLDGSTYRYDDTNEFFVEDDSGTWDGGFLNWLTMRRVDVAREVMIGGKVVDRDGIDIDGTTYYILEGELEVRSQDDFSKQYASSSSVSPIPDNEVINISGAQISANGLSGSATDKVALSDKFEIGYLDRRSWETADYTAPATWPEINFLNTYVNPSVVAVAISNNGGDSSIARAFNVDTDSAQLGLLEWKSTPDNHGAEDYIYYMVAETDGGCHSIELEGSSTMQVCAGKNSIDDVNQSSTDGDVTFSTTFPGSANPAVFAGVSSYNNAGISDLAAQVNTRLGGMSFNALLSRRNGTAATLTQTEEVHWIAVESKDGKTTTGAVIQMGELSVGGSGTTVLTYDSAFGNQPLVAAATQTYSVDTASGDASHFMRFGEPGTDDGGDGWTTTQLELEIQTSDNSNPPSETVAYMAVGGAGAPRIRLALTEEPTGLVQDNNNNVNFGLSVYNFDHKTNSLTGIVNGNKVEGGTMYPCYPIINDADREQMRLDEVASDPYMSIETVELYDGSTRDYFCIPTTVHAPNDSIIKVIEDYPLIWGTTPIAESLVDIGRYVRQDPRGPYYTKDGNSNKEFSNDPFEVFGLDGTSSANGFRWDPYYDEEQGQNLECKSVFVLHFNDGAPYTDFDGSASDHPQPNAGNNNPDIYDIGDSYGYGQNEALDNVALALRANDCRDDSAASGGELDGHQEVVSYFVYADLGANEEEDPPSTSSLRRMREAAARGGFVDSSGDNLPTPMVPTDVNGSVYNDFNSYAALDDSLCPSTEWDNDGDCEPDTFYFATDGSQIGEQLQEALNDILARVASGGAASVISTTANGEGAVFQSQFIPTKTEADEEVTWVGEVSAYMIDSLGYLRHDKDNDDTLDGYLEDPIIFSCYNSADKVARFTFVYWDNDPEGENPEFPPRPTAEQFDDCLDEDFDKLAEEVNPIWSAAEALASIANNDTKSQRSYDADENKRHIKTALPDENGNLLMVDFMPSSFDSVAANFGLLDVASAADAENLINFVRGYEPYDGTMRNRTLNQGTDAEKVYRLGDVIYSTPLAVGRPSERLNLLYEDDTYTTFARAYRDRRTMLYVGANDGMLHAFNGGWFDKNTNQFAGELGDLDQWYLGQEVWAYVPYNLLPHLRYISDPEYGLSDGDHVYLVDQTPYVFDARIFGDDGVTGQTSSDGSEIHPEGWGTVLVVGFRSGGGTVEVYPNPSDTTETATMRPAYLIFDITDPELEPVLLGEFTHEHLGMTMVNPTALTIVGTGENSSTDWFLMFGSGPSATPSGASQVASDQNAHLFLYNLKTQSLQSGFGTNGILDVGANDAANSFIGGISAADWNLDWNTDALYFGTTQGLDTIEDATGTVWPDADNNDIPDGSDGIYNEWAGKLFRVRVEPGTDATTHQWKVDVMYDAEGPITSRPSLSFDDNDNRWLHFGTGRYFNTADHIDDTDGAIVGVKEPRATDGSYEYETAAFGDSVQTISGLIVDTSDAVVTEETGALNGSVAVPVTTTEDTVQELDQLQQAYSESTLYLNGWKRDLDYDGQRGERATGDSLVLGGFVFQTTFAPDIESCVVTGESRFYGIRQTTGTSWWQHIFGDPDTSVNTDEVDAFQDTGSTNTSTPGLHLGENQDAGGATAQINSSGTDSKTIELENLDDIGSKEMSWREL